MKIKVADFIAEFLAQKGVSDVFTITGGGAMHLNDALGHNQNLHCTYNHHEQACAIAAEGYARLTGKIAAVCVTSGPGGTNALTGILGGWLDSIPMFIISGQVKFSTTIKSTEIPLRQLGDQEYNITDSVKYMTKYAVMVIDPLEIKYHLEKAFYIATHGRPGPVWLDIPLNIQGATIETDELKPYSDEDDNEVPPPPTNDIISQVIEKIKNARKPVILAGTGIRLSGGYDEFLKVIDKLNIPVVTAWNAHDVLWDEHPLYCGRPGTVGTRGGNIVLQNSDLLISLGCRMNIRQISYNWDNFAKNAYLIAVDIDKNELKKPTLSIDLPIHADVKTFIEKLLKADYTNQNKKHQEWLKWCKNIDAKYPSVLPEYYNKNSPVNPYVFMKELSKCLSDGDVTVASNGSACVVSFQAMEVKKNQRLFTNSGCASMGYGLPAALGCAVALKGKRVICLEGDGSIQMNLQELQTIVHNNLNIKIFWLNNNGYHSIRQTQTNIFNSNFCGVCSDNGVSFPSAEKIALAYGIYYSKVDNLNSMGKTIEKILKTDYPVICEVILDEKQFFQPKLSSKSLPDGSIVSPSLEEMYPFLPDEEMAKNYFEN